LRAFLSVSMASGQPPQWLPRVALANYGTHREVAAGRTDLRFDLVASFVASKRAPELFAVKRLAVEVTEWGRVVEVEGGGSGAASTVNVVARWADDGASRKFNELTNRIVAGEPLKLKPG